MTARLAALYAVSALVILLGAASVLHYALVHDLRSEDMRLLVTKAGELQQVAHRFPERPDMLQEEVVFEPAAPRLEPYFARVVGADGRTILESDGMATLLPAARFRALSDPIQPTRPVLWRSPSGRSFLLYSSLLRPGTAQGERIQLALDVTHDAAVLTAYRNMLLLVILIGTVLSGLAGYLAARRGLRPIHRITETAKEVSAVHLDRRIAAVAWPAELAELASVFDGMLDRLEVAFGRLSRFSADLAHELRTPLTNLRGEAEVALGRARSAAEYREVVGSALEEYGRLTDLVDRLLFLARAEAGSLPLSPELIDLAVMLQDVCDYYGPLAEEAGVELTCAGTGSVSADPLLLRRAIGNLVENALEHTGSGGQVWLSAEENGAEVRCSVADTGCGIPPEHLPRLFDRFYQVEPSRERRRPGAGLGLSLVQSIADLHSGTVTVESHPGVGTTVVLHLPQMVTAS